MNRNLLGGLGAAIVLSLFLVTGCLVNQGWALPVLTITDGANSTTIQDDNGDGVLNFSGTVGGWDITISLASSYPAIGEADAPEMHLTGATTSLSSDGNITFTFEDTFSEWNPNISGLISRFGGVASSGSEIKFYTYLNDNLLANFGPETGAFSDSLASMITPANSNNYSLKIVGVISTTASGQAASFDGGIAPVPEPATILLFGFGLIGLAGIARKKVKK